MTALVTVRRPETGTVGCEHLIAQYQIAVFIQTELEFCIGDDDPAAERVIGTFFIECQGSVAQRRGVLLTFAGEVFLQVNDTLLIGNVLVVVTDLRFGGRGVDRLGKFV